MIHPNYITSSGPLRQQIQMLNQKIEALEARSGSSSGCLGAFWSRVNLVQKTGCYPVHPTCFSHDGGSPENGTLKGKGNEPKLESKIILRFHVKLGECNIV